jgi:hypothetical protein
VEDVVVPEVKKFEVSNIPSASAYATTTTTSNSVKESCQANQSVVTEFLFCKVRKFPCQSQSAVVSFDHILIRQFSVGKKMEK